MKKGMALSILTAMVLGLITNGLISWRELAVAQSNIVKLEKEDAALQDSISRIEDKLLDIHWYLIGSKNIKVDRPTILKRSKRGVYVSPTK